MGYGIFYHFQHARVRELFSLAVTVDIFRLHRRGYLGYVSRPCAAQVVVPQRTRRDIGVPPAFGKAIERVTNDLLAS